MRKFKEAKFPSRPIMALITSEFIGPGCVILWADFRDTHALYLERVGRFLGFNQDGVVLIGKKELNMIDGVWLLEEDPEMIIKHQNIALNEASLKIIQ